MVQAQGKLVSRPDLIESADVHSASDDYKARFSGAAGRWMLGVQEKIVLRLLSSRPGSAVLDVGGGHGQVARPLSAHGFKVTVIASSTDGLTQVRDLTVNTQTGDLLRLPYRDREFPVVTCFRLLPHSVNWRGLIAELCRVAQESVIVDFPTPVGINALSPLLFGLKKGVEKNTRSYQLFSVSQIRDAFCACGFQLVSVNKQFFFPMVLHRLLKNGAISELLEVVPRCLGLTKLVGSPVIIEAKRTNAGI